MADTFKVTSVVTVNDNPIDENSRRIRLQPKSKNNIAKNIRNVPVKSKTVEPVQEEKTVDNSFLPQAAEVFTTTAPVIEPAPVEQVIDHIFNDIEENNNTYEVDKPITEEEKNVMDNTNVEETNNTEMEVESTEVNEDTNNFDELSSLNDALASALNEEKEEKARAEETRIKYESTMEEYRKATKEYRDALLEKKATIQKSIEESNRRRDQYRETVNEMDKKIADTVGETAAYREKISYLRSIGNDNNDEVVKKIA